MAFNHHESSARNDIERDWGLGILRKPDKQKSQNMLLLVNLRNLRAQKHSKEAGVFGDDVICKSQIGPRLREKTSAVYSFVVGK